MGAADLRICKREILSTSWSRRRQLYKLSSVKAVRETSVESMSTWKSWGEMGEAAR